MGAEGTDAGASGHCLARGSLGGVSRSADWGFVDAKAANYGDRTPQCFDEMCFTVAGVEEVKGFLIRDGRRLMRVTIRVTNRGGRQRVTV